MRRSLVSLFLAASIAACSSTTGGTTDAGTPVSGEAALVVGVQSPELGTLVGSWHIVVKKDGAVVMDRSSSFAPGAPTVLAESVDVAGPVGSLIEASVDLLPANGGTPIITRSASTHLVAGQKRLLRLRLDTRCVVVPGVNGSPPIGLTCAAPTTCAMGVCVPIEVGEGGLEDWVPDWQNAPPPDICRPAKPGPPELILGTGQTDYAPLMDGQELQLEQGPQGGHHIWMAVRMKNLRQSGSTTTVTSTVMDGPQVLAPLAVVFSFDRDEGGYCKVYGLRYQMDVSGLAPDGQSIPAPNYHDFLGKTVKVTAEVVDSTGARASASRTIHLKDKILCADGTEACNTSP